MKNKLTNFIGYLGIIALILTGYVAISCEPKNDYDVKNNIYVDKHKLYSVVDSAYTGITVYYAKERGHDVIYHVFNGKNKGQMVVWHMEEDCSKCIVAKKKAEK